MFNRAIVSVLMMAGLGSVGAQAQQAASAQATPPAQSSAAPAPLVLLFDNASSKIRAQDTAVLDKASRAYSEGHPIVMIVTGSSDRVGPAVLNLRLSQKRANAVLNGLIERGIPAERFEVLAKGEADIAHPNSPGVANPENRRVEITWR